MDEKTKIKYLQKYFIVKKYIDEMDYYSLLSGGAPNDEFDMESQKISNKITNTHNKQDIAQIIADVFNGAFNEEDEPHCFLDCAQKIYSDLHN